MWSRPRSRAPRTATLALAGVLVVCAPAGVPVDAEPPTPAAARSGAAASPVPDNGRGRPDCPPELRCGFVPAGYRLDDATRRDGYGNYDLAGRERGEPAIRYVVIHNSEVAHETTVQIFRNPLNRKSSHYVLRSSDGEVTQMVDIANVAWHAGNWNVNMHAIGYEHEGSAIDGRHWYTDAMYRASATLTRYLAAKYGIRLDRAHVIGHDEIPGPTPFAVPRMHWDPGPFWDWARYMDLLGAPITATATSGNVVTIMPPFAGNRPPIRDCLGRKGLLPPQPANFVYLYEAPDPAAPLFDDPGLPGAGTDCASDWGDKAVTGQTFYRVERRGDWDAIAYAGRTAWFHNPGESNTVLAQAALITPKPDVASIPVYGRAYPEASDYPSHIAAQEVLPLEQYTIPAGQIYVAYEKVNAEYYAEYYWPTILSDPPTYRLVTGQTEYYVISFNHRLAFVKADDVVMSAP